MTRSGFTLVELLIVLAIIGVLVGLLLPAVHASREAARRTQCSNNLKQVALAAHLHTDAKGRLPLGTQNHPTAVNFPWGQPRQSWVPYLLPYVEQSAVYALYNFQLGGHYGNANSATPQSPTGIVVPMFLCPSDDGVQQIHMNVGYFGLGNYLPFFGGLNLGGANPANLQHKERAAFGLNFGAQPADFLDGTSHTMIFGEYLRSTGEMDGNGPEARGNIWESDEPGGGSIFTQYSPNSSSQDVFYTYWWCTDHPERNQPCRHGSTDGSDHTAAARSRHTGGVGVVMGDGSVRFADETIALNVWQAMATIAASEMVTE